MKKDTLPRWIIQLLIINILIFSWIIFMLNSYFYPEYKKIEDKKTDLENIKNEKLELSKYWLKYEKFKLLFNKNKKTNWEYINNIYSDPTKEFKSTYISNLVSSWTGSYNDFILKLDEKIEERKEDLSKSNIKEVVEKILPFYKSSSNFKDKWITDFEFINYIENILYNFQLEYEWNIWITNLVSEEEKNNKQKNSELSWNIYSFNLPLKITWTKRDIINFLYYIENIWSVSFTKKWDSIKIKEMSYYNVLIDNKWKTKNNDFKDMEAIFNWKKDIFNNILVTIDSINFNDYIDNSLQIRKIKKESFISFLKKWQWDEEYNIDIKLKFYVKWQEIIKIKNYINKTINRYNIIKTSLFSWIKYWKNIKTKKTNSINYSIKQIEKYSSYILSIDKDIKELSDSKKIKNEIWNLYKKSENYNRIFELKSPVLDIHLKNISENIYNKYKKQIEVLNKKKEKND